MDILQEVEKAKTIGISGHIRPDGDCIGSCMGLFLYLKKARSDAQIRIFLEKPEEIYDCIDQINEVRSDFITDIDPFDAFIVLDSVPDRIGEAEKFYRSAKKTINIDHHISNPGCSNVNFIMPEASSASEMVYMVLPDKAILDVEIAKAIYLGIIHDTGVFQYSNTSPDTLRIAAQLITYGFDFPKLIDSTFYEKTYVQNQILGRALLESFTFMDGKCIVSQIDMKTMDFYHAHSYDLDGIVNHLRSTKGVECAILMYQVGTMEYKVSMRSNGNVDVSKVAVFFGGGGHVRASGATIQGTFYDIVNNLSAQIALQLK